MNEESISAKDFKIRNLERMVHERDEEIKSLNDRLETTVYWSLLAADLWEKSRLNVQAAARGELRKPTLRME